MIYRLMAFAECSRAVAVGAWVVIAMNAGTGLAEIVDTIVGPALSVAAVTVDVVRIE